MNAVPILRIVRIASISMVTFGVVTFNTALGASPVIHLSWNDGPGPFESIHYEIDSTNPDFPNVELIAGSLTWRVWSTDSDNPDNLGDIGVISCPHPNNFAVTIRNDADPFLRGARHVKGITLVPSSPTNYSNILDSTITGDLTEDLIVQDDTSGVGGELSLHIAGAVTADITAHKVHALGIVE